MGFAKWLTEAKAMLDISILPASKVLRNADQVKDFMEGTCTIEAKTDGVKLTVLKVADNGNLDDYIIAYKGGILYQEEYGYTSIDTAKNRSIGNGQFKLALKHFAKLGRNSIPVGTELQIEFLLSKPTLSSNYTHKHGMVLIQCSKSKYTAEFGQLRTTPIATTNENIEKYAKELKLDTPAKIFNGSMRDEKSFLAGIVSPALLRLYNAEHVDWNDLEVAWSQISKMLLAIPSAYGGVEEGVVIKTPTKIFKLQQSYQVDQAARALIKQKWREDDPATENEYWSKVILAANEIVNSIPELGTDRELMTALANKVKAYRLGKLRISHSKKLPEMIKDDIQLNAKTLLLKRMAGNNGCLVLGKFRVLTKGHQALINRALKEYDRVAVAIVSSKVTASTAPLRREMMERTFGNKITLIEHPSGAIMGMFKKIPFNINAVFAGSDRVPEYKEQLSKIIGVNVRELYRTDEDISASKVIDNIDNEAFFKASTPAAIHPMYNEIRAAYSN